MRSHSWPLEQLPGLQAKPRQQLAQLDITTTADLLRHCRTPAARQTLANQLHLPLRYVQKWVALCDLARVPPVGCHYNGLLLHAGIVSVAQLAQCPLGQLHRRIQRLHVTTLTRSDLCPPPDEIAGWIRGAKQLMAAHQSPPRTSD